MSQPRFTFAWPESAVSPAATGAFVPLPLACLAAGHALGVQELYRLASEESRMAARPSVLDRREAFYWN